MLSSRLPFHTSCYRYRANYPGITNILKHMLSSRLPFHTSCYRYRANRGGTVETLPRRQHVPLTPNVLHARPAAICGLRRIPGTEPNLDFFLVHE